MIEKLRVLYVLQLSSCKEKITSVGQRMAFDIISTIKSYMNLFPSLLVNDKDEMMPLQPCQVLRLLFLSSCPQLISTRKCQKVHYRKEEDESWEEEGEDA